jgi:hypothetical protein
VVFSLNNVIMPSFHSSHAGLNYQNLGQLCQCNCVRVHPYAHPQHMMVLKHFPYIQYRCGKWLVVVFSLNNVIMPSFHSSHAGQYYQTLGQLCQCNISVRVHPYAHPQHMIMLKHFLHLIRMWEVVRGGLFFQKMILIEVLILCIIFGGNKYSRKISSSCYHFIPILPAPGPPFPGVTV